MSFFRDLKIAVRSLSRVRCAVDHGRAYVGIGYRRQCRNLQRGAGGAAASAGESGRRPAALPAPERAGHRDDNATFSVPEIQDMGAGLKTIKELGTFSTIDFTVVGLGTPREIPAGVVDGHYFEVMGLRPVLGRLLTRPMTGRTPPERWC